MHKKDLESVLQYTSFFDQNFFHAYLSWFNSKLKIYDDSRIFYSYNKTFITRAANVIKNGIESI